MCVRHVDVDHSDNSFPNNNCDCTTMGKGKSCLSKSDRLDKYRRDHATTQQGHLYSILSSIAGLARQCRPDSVGHVSRRSVTPFHELLSRGGSSFYHRTCEMIIAVDSALRVVGPYDQLGGNLVSVVRPNDVFRVIAHSSLPIIRCIVFDRVAFIVNDQIWCDWQRELQLVRCCSTQYPDIHIVQ